MTKEQLLEELCKLVSQLTGRQEISTSKVICKLMELINFLENPDDLELNKIHTETTLKLIVYDLKKYSDKIATETTSVK